MKAGTATQPSTAKTGPTPVLKEKGTPRAPSAVKPSGAGAPRPGRKYVEARPSASPAGRAAVAASAAPPLVVKPADKVAKTTASGTAKKPAKAGGKSEKLCSSMTSSKPSNTTIPQKAPVRKKAPTNPTKVEEPTTKLDSGKGGGKKGKSGKKPAGGGHQKPPPKKDHKSGPKAASSGPSTAGGRRVDEVVADERATGIPTPIGDEQPCQLPETTEEKPSPRVRTAFERPWVLTPKVLEITNRTFPMYNIRERPNSRLASHDHPVSAIERALTEDLAYEILVRAGCGSITDVGGNPSRHCDADRVIVHSCCPVLSPGDVIRNARYNGWMDYCTLKSEECEREADGYMMIHSIYYLEPKVVLGLLLRSKLKIVVATAHKFTSGYGQMHFDGTSYESQFAITSSRTVEMTVRGNDHGAYVHDPVFWLDTNYFSDGENAMAWGYRKYGDTYLYTFRPAPLGLNHGVSKQALSLFDSAGNDEHYGEVKHDLSLYRPTVNLLNIETASIRSYGPLFWTSRKSQDIFVPKNLVNKLAVYMVGKPRNKDTWQMCVRETKKLVGEKVLCISESLRVMLCIHVPALAFVIHLDDEIAAFNSLLEPRRVEAYKHLTNALSFVARPLRCFERVVRVLRPNTLVVSAMAQSTISGSGGRQGSLDDDGSLTVSDIEGTYAQSHAILSTVQSKAIGGFKFVATPALGGLKAMRAKASVYIRGPGKDVDDSKPKLFQTSVVFSDHAPVVAQGTQVDDVSALRNRVVMQVGGYDAEYWDSMRAYLKEQNYVDTQAIRDRINFDEDSAFSQWNSGFPKGKQRNQLEAYERLKSRPLEAKDFVRKTFCKKEKNVKLHCDEGELEEFIPRAIQGATDEANVALGPFISQVSKALALQWNGRGKFYYTSGATGTSVGAWACHSYHPGDYLCDIDFTTYDGTQNRETFNTSREFYRDCGSDDYGHAGQVLDSHKDIHGYTLNDVEYRVDDGMCSGNPDTSSTNSKGTGDSADYGYYTLFGRTDDIKIAVMGDDNTAIIPARYMVNVTPEQLREHMIAHFHRLGYIAKVNVTDSLAKAEFCSGLFWPAVVDGVETLVLGAKPGKQLPKIGYSLKPHSPAVVAGMMDGLLVSYAHVPLLRDYVVAMRAKLPEKAVAYVDAEARYKIGAPSQGASMSAHTAGFFEERYGLNLDIVSKSLGELLLRSDLHEMVHWAYLDAIIAVDC